MSIAMVNLGEQKQPIEKCVKSIKRIVRLMIGFKSFRSAKAHPARHRTHADNQERPTVLWQQQPKLSVAG